ncbi:MAG: sulfurtransferase TusA family protein [Christensenella sp.]|nr:sulfurtransferase TusA family protein [Christensenella sp.]
MMIVDARGLLCPEPVVRTQRAVKDGLTELTVLVDAEAAKENVTRFAASRGYNVTIKQEGADYTLSLTRA